MSYDPSPAVSNAFASIAPANPLSTLNASDRKYLWALLLVYACQTAPRAKGSAGNEPLRRLSALVADAAKLGERLESELFGGPFSDVLGPFTAGFEDLPARLKELSRRVGEASDSVGKRGHQHKTMANQFLIEASEFVRVRTGQHYDEHLAELFQAVAAGRRPLSEDMSGDAIRKKRDYTLKNYPILYAHAVDRARREHATSSHADSTTAQ